MVRLENVTKVAESFVESALSRSATSSTISPFDKIVTSELSREGRLMYREHFYTPRHNFSVTMSSAFMAISYERFLVLASRRPRVIDSACLQIRCAVCTPRRLDSIKSVFAREMLDKGGSQA